VFNTKNTKVHKGHKEFHFVSFWFSFVPFVVLRGSSSPFVVFRGSHSLFVRFVSILLQVALHFATVAEDGYRLRDSPR
jgi:hypothetical protein